MQCCCCFLGVISDWETGVSKKARARLVVIPCAPPHKFYDREGDWERGRICPTPCETGTSEPVSDFEPNENDLVVTVTFIDFQCYTGYKGIYLILKHSRYLTTSERLVSLIRFDPRLSSNEKVARFFLLERATLTV